MKCAMEGSGETGGLKNESARLGEAESVNTHKHHPCHQLPLVPWT